MDYLRGSEKAIKEFKKIGDWISARTKEQTFNYEELERLSSSLVFVRDYLNSSYEEKRGKKGGNENE